MSTSTDSTTATATTSRQFRLQKISEADVPKFQPGMGGVSVAPGEYGRRPGDAVKNADGTFTFGKKMFIDDWAKVLLLMCESNININKEEKIHLAHFIDAMDVRAMNKHGYSHSPEEAGLNLPSLSSNYE